jgi:hypothetical protein
VASSFSEWLMRTVASGSSTIHPSWVGIPACCHTQARAAARAARIAVNASVPDSARGVDRTRDRRVGGHQTEHAWLGAQHGDVRSAVTTHRDRDGQVHQDLRAVVNRARDSPWPHAGGQVPLQAADTGGLGEQDRAGGGDH